jgi:putative membrane protein
MKARLAILVLLGLIAVGPAAFAHSTAEATSSSAGPSDWHELWEDWPFEPLVVVPLMLTAALYARGLRRLWREAGVGHGVRRQDAACFAAGWLALAIALVSPLHPWGNVLFSAHMMQHEILMLVAAPLFVMGQPLIAFLKAIPGRWARHLVQWTKPAWFQATWRLATQPFVAWLFHAVVLWTWHIPSLFHAALESEVVHALQHVSFLLSALLFWWAVFHGRQRAMSYGAGVLYMFTTAVHSGVLGALITLATVTWYPDYAHRTAAWGLTPLEDQQLGGLIMWVPACTVYIFAGLFLFAGLAALFRKPRAPLGAKHDGPGGPNAMKMLTPLFAFVLLALPACESPQDPQERANVVTGGASTRGPAAIQKYGCASCHTIPGIIGADANVGPPLARVGGRVYIAGVLMNTPDNMVRWIKNPPEVDPKTAVPNLSVSDEDVKDIAAYLYTLR